MSKRRYPKSEDDNRRVIGDGPAYVSWDNEKDRGKAIAAYSEALGEAEYAAANYRRNFAGVTSYSDGRPGLRSADFDWFRPDQTAPIKPKDIISYARFVYRRVGIIHNAIDLMGDFACQGVRIVHPNSRVEAFYNSWFRQVNGKFVSERLGHLLFREANVPIRMFTAKINKGKRLKMQKVIGKADISATKDEVHFNKAEVPWKYNFLDPLLVEPVGGSLSTLYKRKLLSLQVPHYLKQEIRRLIDSRDPKIKSVLEDISPDIIQAVQDNKNILLPQDKTYIYHYKKDDWQTWADPMTYSAFEPLNLYQRLQLADKAALDGAISKIRVWKIGNFEYKMMPSPTASTTLGNMLGANVGGGTIDIVWGPDIELIETSSDVGNFLGEEKYIPTLMAIYATLGIPPTLTGTFGAAGTTNNFISLKTLTERLNYVRSIIIEFWTEQLELVQKAMGFRLPAHIEFDFMYLDDPSAVATLLMNMADRNIISDEFVQRHIKANPTIESRRVLAENKKREQAGVEKISPYHEVDKQHGLKKIALQSGVSAPSEVGLELEAKKSGEESALKMKESQMKMGRPSGPGNSGTPGRPKNTKDSTPRQKRTFKPQNKAAVEMWAKQAQESISAIINPQILNSLNKKQLRSLTSAQFSELEMLKFEILCNLDMDSDLSEAVIARACQKPNNQIHAEFNAWVDDALECLGQKSFTIDELRDLRVSFYVNKAGE